MKNQYRNKEDSELWSHVREDDDSTAFAEIHRRYSPKLFDLAHRKLGDSTTAEDIVQDLFVAFWFNRSTIQIDKTFSSYLFSSLKNRIISHLRLQYVQRSVSLDNTDSGSLSTHSANLVQDWIHANELQEIYFQEIRSLPDKSRQVFELSRSGLTNKEIADLLQLAEKTIEFHITKCLRLLRSRLKYAICLLFLFFV